MKNLILSVVLLTTIVTTVSAYDCVVNGIYYKLNGNTASVTYNNFDGNDYSGTVSIPSSFSYNNTSYTVTSIGADAFYDCESLSSVTIPNSVTSIGDYAFMNCESLSSITIPNSVTSLGIRSFSNCQSLSSLFIPNSVTSIGNYAFVGCSSLSSISVDADNQYYDSRNNCNAIIHSASKKLIVGCSSTVIPNSVLSIEDYAFYKCAGLQSINIPNSVTSIGNYAFVRCSSLSSISVDAGNLYYDSRNNCNAIIHSVSKNLIVGCSSTVIPNSVLSIGGYAFYGCAGLQSINIPNSVTDIYLAAFGLCTQLHSVVVPGSVTDIGEGAFYGCRNLDSLTFKGTTTPSTYSNGLFAIDDDVIVPIDLTFYVPCSSWSSYNNLLGSYNFPIVEDDATKADVTLYVNDNAMGTTTGSGSYCFNQGQSHKIVSISATAYTGYRFLQWNDGNTSNPRNIDLTHDTVFSATFESGQTPSSDTVFVHDTTFVHDTITAYVHDTIIAYVYDTVIAHMYDTVYVHDTIVAYITDTIYLEYDGTSATQYALEDYGVYYFMGTVTNPNGIYIKLYAADGKLISSGTSDIDLGSCPNGIYIVTDGKGGFLKINHYKNE
ncbi:MAG: leucine-rich repeat domain-containing protein [bacterium]|nr:leucine-rich repeat domain-containing protein [Candidatus Colousia faecequi]